MAKVAYRKKAYKKRAAKGKARKLTNVPEIASLSVTRSLLNSGTSPATLFQTNALYSLMNVQLSDYTRAVSVSRAYQEYRITNIKLRLKPFFDSYIATSGNPSKPNFYHMLDKSGTIPTNITLEGLKQMGAKPKIFDERGIHISWKPCVASSVGTSPFGATTSTARPVPSPWLACNTAIAPSTWSPSSVDHLGVYWYMEQFLGQGAFTFSVECEVQFQFRKSSVSTPLGQVHAQTAVVAEEDDSPDGIVGFIENPIHN